MSQFIEKIVLAVLAFLFAAGPQAVWAASPTMTTAACRDFTAFATPAKETKDSFKTDGIVVSRKGETLFEYYDADPTHGGNERTGLYDRQTPHALWSASKTITATLMGRAIFELRRDSNLFLGTATKVSSLLEQPMAARRPSDAGYFDQITVENLLNMSAGFVWNESYESDIRTSTFLPMLYLHRGHRDMLNYALSQPMGVEGPGNRWNYSGGNSIILMGLLKKIYDDHAFSELPWTLLFNELGMKDVVFERDDRGVFIGNSYVYMRPLDMVKFGELFLNDGVVGGKRLLDSEWIREAQTLSPATLNENTPLDYIKSEGVFSSRSFWLNQGVRGYGPEFPSAPRDMYFAAGHYGQLIIVLPTQSMVIARTGHDAEYWKKIDPFVSKAVRCFAPESAR